MLRRPAIVSVLLFLTLFLTACGYVGPVQPPSPEIPNQITDLVAVERGDKLIITFTTPARTTDGVAITKFTSIDLRVGADDKPPESAKAYAVDLPIPSDKDDPQPKPMAYSIDASDWANQHIAVIVRTSVKKTGHFSAWSNRVALNVIPPLEKPVVTAAGSADGMLLTWPASGTGIEYHVQRQGPSDKQPFEIGIANEARFVDRSAQYDTDYRYVVTAKKGGAESLASEPVAVNAQDKYPPAIPSGLTILAGPDSIELAWQRNAESDFQGYYIYRSTNNGPFERQGTLAGLPAYTDHQVEHGKTYAYKISAIDKKGNESAPSSPADIQF